MFVKPSRAKLLSGYGVCMSCPDPVADGFHNDNTNHVYVRVVENSVIKYPEKEFLEDRQKNREVEVDPGSAVM